MPSELDDAREAIKYSDDHQGEPRYTPANRAETAALRDAVRALIQHSEHLEERMAALEHTVPLHLRSR